MSRKSLNQKGFGAVETLLFLILIAILVFTGYYVYHSQKTANNIYNSADTVTQKSSAVAAPKYLDIKELGVKFRVSGAISTAYYVKNADGYYYLSVHSFDNTPQLAGCEATTGNPDSGAPIGVVALTTAKVGQPNGDFAGDLWTADSIKQAGLKQVGNTYYGFQKGNGVCYDPSTTSSTDQDQVSQVIQAFENATSTFVKD